MGFPALFFVTSALSAGAKVAGSAIQNSVNNRNTMQANRLQRDLQRDAMMYNDLSAQKARDYDSLASRIRQLRQAGMSPSLAVDMQSNSPSPSVSAPAAHAAPPSADFDTSPILDNLAQRMYQNDLQRAQTLATLSQAGLTDKQKSLVDAQINEIIENSNYKLLDYMDRHTLNQVTIRQIDAQIDDIKKQRELAEKEFEHKQKDDAEKNRIAEKVGTYNENIKTFEYVKNLISDFLDGNDTAQEIVDKVASAPDSVFNYFTNMYGSLKRFIESFNPGGSRHLDWSRYDKRKGSSKVDRVNRHRK